MPLQPLIFRIAVLLTLLLLPQAIFGQAARPAAEFRSLLNIGFSEDEGVFTVEGLQVIFPPEGYERATLTVNRSSGEEVFNLPLRFEPYSSLPIFGKLVPDNQRAEIKLGQSGDFVFTIKVADHVITRMPFTLNVKPNGKPYDPPRKFVREGPWRDLAYFSVPMGSPGGNVDFNWWMSVRELPIGMTKPLVTVHLFLGAREIARSPDRLALKDFDWQFFTTNLVQNTRNGMRYLTLADLSKIDDECLLIIEANGKPIKSFPVKVEGGRIQRPAQSRLDFEPHSDFISPRMVDTSAKSADYLMRDVYWVKRSAVTRTFPQLWRKNVAGNPPVRK